MTLNEPGCGSGQVRHPLDGQDLKLKRAEQHLDSLLVESAKYVEAQPYRIFGKWQPDEGWGFHVRVVRQPSLGLGVILGDFVHNARSALDQTVWQLVRVTPAHPGRHNSFPIVLSKAKWLKDVEKPRQSDANSPLKGVSDEAFAYIKTVQPLHQGERAPDDPIAHLQELSNTDKHRLIHPTVFRNTGRKAGLRLVGSDASRFTPELDWHTGIPLEDGASIGRLKVPLGMPKPDVRVEGPLPIEVRFGESELSYQDLEAIFNKVVHIVTEIGNNFF